MQSVLFLFGLLTKNLRFSLTRTANMMALVAPWGAAIHHANTPPIDRRHHWRVDGERPRASALIMKVFIIPFFNFIGKGGPSIFKWSTLSMQSADWNVRGFDQERTFIYS